MLMQINQHAATLRVGGVDDQRENMKWKIWSETKLNESDSCRYAIVLTFISLNFISSTSLIVLSYATNVKDHGYGNYG